jgi:DMSO/TMAO reductase YedYZ molybdopterin-dependent catalytic subunit
MALVARRLLLVACMLAMGTTCLWATSCGDSDSPAAGGPEVTETSAAEVLLEVDGLDGIVSYTLDELKDMRITEGYGGIKNSTGRITPPVLVKGVLLEDLFAEVGGLPDDMAVSVVAKDGYEMTMSAEQIRTGDFITYDMVTGEEKTVAEPLSVVIAYEYDGQPIDPESAGPLRLAVVSPEQNQVIDGHWSVRWVTRIQVKPIVQEWTVLLKGMLTEEMDRATFESGSAEGCHGQDWTDEEGNSWSGIPLYLLVGRVDDDIAHEGPAYNRELAKAGYLVRIVTAEGRVVEIASETMYYNKDLIVAYELNGEPLPEEYWPLRIVGEGIDATDMVGQITEIEALVPAD